MNEAHMETGQIRMIYPMMTTDIQNMRNGPRIMYLSEANAVASVVMKPRTYGGTLRRLALA